MRILSSIFLCQLFLNSYSQGLFNEIFKWRNTSESIVWNNIPDSIYVPTLSTFKKNSYHLIYSSKLSRDFLQDTILINCDNVHSDYKIREIVIKKDFELNEYQYDFYHIIHDSIVVFYCSMDAKFCFEGLSSLRFYDDRYEDCDRPILENYWYLNAFVFNKCRGDVFDFTNRLYNLQIANFTNGNLEDERKIIFSRDVKKLNGLYWQKTPCFNQYFGAYFKKDLNAKEFFNHR